MIEKIYNFNEKIDLIMQKNKIIDDIFRLLTKIDQLTVETVKKLIINSIQIQSEEGIQELVTIIVQTVSNSIKIQSNIIELITSLSNNSDENNSLHLLVATKVKHILNRFHLSINLCSFAYKLVKKKLFINR